MTAEIARTGIGIHENAPAHTVAATGEFFIEQGISTIPHHFTLEN